MKLTFLGDIMCKASMLSSYKNSDGGYDFSSIFENVIELLKKSSFVCGNLETPISRDRNSYSTELYSFCTPIEFASSVKKAGVDFVSTANNHCLDRGIDGLYETINCLDEIGIKHTGVFKNKNQIPLVIEVEGIKIGLMSYTYGTNAFSNHNYLKKTDYWRVNLFQNQEMSSWIERLSQKNQIVYRCYNKILKILHHPNYALPIYERRENRFNCRRRLIKQIKEMKVNNPDIIVMSMHTGGQYNKVASKDTVSLTEFLLSKGINIIAGTHEHVVHGGTFERMSSKKIGTYSLGNFDGTAGVYDKPFDKMSEYSIAFHVYVSKRNEETIFDKTTFSILKTVKSSKNVGGVSVYPIYDLISNTTDEETKNQLILDMYEIGKRFCGHNVSDQGVVEEFTIFDNNQASSKVVNIASN